MQCLRKSLTPEQFAEIEPQLTRHYQELLADPVRDGEEIIVPTQSLYMQMIVDTGKALEQFKEAHRLIDVMKVKAEVRSAELDNLRRAKLVLGDKLGDSRRPSRSRTSITTVTPRPTTATSRSWPVRWRRSLRAHCPARSRTTRNC